MAKFKFVVSTNHLDLISPTRVMADWLNSTSMEFVFRSDEWKNAEKWAHLSNPDYNDGQIYDFNLIDDRIDEDRGLNLAPGIWEIYLHGITTTEDGKVDKRFVTDSKTFRIVASEVTDGQPLPVIEASVSEQIDAKATAALNARITSASATIDDRYGVPSVDVEITGEAREKNLSFDFHNLKGNGIKDISFETEGEDAGKMTVEMDNGTAKEYTGIRDAIKSIDDLINNQVDYEKLSNIPSINSTKLIGDVSLTALGLRGIYYDTKENWDAQAGLVSEAGALYVYSNYKTVEDEVGNITNIPGIRIGDGKAYLIDLPFLSGSLSEEILDHIENQNIHVSAADREFWNNKVTAVLDTVDNENIIFTKAFI